MKLKKNKLNIKLLLFFLFILIIINISSTVFAKTSKPEISSPSAILVDNYTGSIVYEKNIDKKMYPASTTKILTAILTIENCNLSANVTASYDAIMSVPYGYSIADIKVGESLTVQELLEVLMVHSANDAANVLGEYVGGSIESFASMMNTKATEIGCKNSHFVNPSGKHDENHYSTARDLSLIMQYCMKNSTFKKLSSLRSCTLPTTSFSPERKFNTTVELLIPNTPEQPNIYYYPYAIAGKTGFTTEAQNCLVSVAKKDNLEFTSVILGSGKTENGQSARFLETKEIYDYGFDNYKYGNVCKQNDVLQTIDVPWATPETKQLDLVVDKTLTAFAKVSEDLSSVEPNIILKEDIQAPITKNQVLGTVTYTVNNINYKANIIASHDVEKSVYSDLIVKIGIILLLIIIFVLIFVIIKNFSKKNKN